MFAFANKVLRNWVLGKGRSKEKKKQENKLFQNWLLRVKKERKDIKKLMEKKEKQAKASPKI